MPPVATLDELAAYLTDGYWANSPISFSTTGSNAITVDIRELTVDGQKLARWAFEAWEMVADIAFVEIGTAGADIVFDDEEEGAYTTTNLVGERVTDSFVNVAKDWLMLYGDAIDGYAFYTYMHEIGHALGLGHLGAYNLAATYGKDAIFANDSWQVSVMSYFDQVMNTEITASYAQILTPMMADIVAIQAFYGPPGGASVTAGDTVWGANSTLDNYVGTYFDLLARGGTVPRFYTGDPVTLTLYDHSGIDTVDLSFSTTDDYLDLHPESFSDIGGLIGNLAIARGTLIEHAISGTGDDTLIGNATDNMLTAGAGSDVLFAYGGSDTLFGDAGNDLLRGGAQADSIFAGSGKDTVLGDNGTDTVWLGEGNDLFEDNSQSGVFGADLIFGEQGLDTLNAGGGNDTLNGGAGHDLLRGGAADDRLNGGAQDDLLIGNRGNDTLHGGRGRDEARMGDGDDLYLDVAQVRAGSDVVWGGRGDDRIELAGGNDTASGGEGTDSFIFAAAINHDVITDYEPGSDALIFDAALVGGRSAQDLVDQARLQGGDLVLVFSEGHSVTLQGITGKTGLADDISFF